MKFPAELQR